MNRREFGKMLLATAGMGAYAALNPGRARGADIPTSPFVLNPFSDPLPIPTPMTPSDPATWGGPLPNPAAHQIWMEPAEYYRIKLEVAEHNFTSSLVRGPGGTTRSLPASTIYGYNGTFPGPMIRARYGRPTLVRFENHLGDNPLNLDRGDFGVPEMLVHLHNGHTAPESDGNPYHRPMSYQHGEYQDNLYLNWPPEGDDREKQSTLWFHDHTHGNTGSNVYKGMVGLYPLFDEKDCGDETRGYRLPSGDYDIPMAFYDCALDDGVTDHDGIGQDGKPHPENWGKLFYGHYVNHGFVGDVFTVNGKIQPYLEVKRRKYRFRWLDASIARWYDFKLMSGSPVPAPGVQGQYLLNNAQQVMRFTLIAGDGGLIHRPLVQDTIHLIPAKRRCVIVDFCRYMDGSPTKPGDVVYLTNILEMEGGRKPDGQTPGYNVPVLKFIIGDDPPTPDLSVVPPFLRPIPPVPPASHLAKLPTREWVLERSGGEWLINDEAFDPQRPLAYPKKGSEEVWIFRNGGGGWVHPMHMHQEEHRVISRNGVPARGDDISKEDVIAVHENEEVAIYRKFRSFSGNYVTHCHNLAHEDHAMMFAWKIVP